MDLSKVVLAIGSLGTAAYGVVDASKCFGGGVSNSGFGDIQQVVSKFIPGDANDKNAPALALASVLATLRANWLNGMALADQKAIAKTLIKLNLRSDTANVMASAAGVDAALLTSVANKLATGEGLTQAETDVYGRFDLLLSSILDQGYERADQRYRNTAKMLAVPIAVVLAILGGWTIVGEPFLAFLGSADAVRALIAGLLATPLAPVAKDLSTAIQAAAKVAQSWKS
ncbi:MAG TPA: hypothetical protein VFB04_05100 [Terriglobales bacterium]|nr:hypothetical protein [Terriglobales bacterium]